MDKRDEVKKTSKASLETHRNTFFLMGVVVAAAVLFFAFEWSTDTRKLDENMLVSEVLAEEEIEITRREAEPPPPPPPPEPETPEIIEVVEERVEERFDIKTEDDASKRQVETYVPPPPPKPKEEVTDEIFIVVEEQPEFPGGEAAMMKFLRENMKYPPFAQENNIQGRVICTFVVERDGSITDVQVVRGVDPTLDREAVRVVQEMPRWKPARQQGSAVRFRFTLPVNFRLQN